MMSQLFTRRSFSVRLASFFSAFGIAGMPWRSTARATTADSNQGISRTAEAIHQEMALKATPSRVYEAIVEGKRFSKMTGAPAQISGDAGGTFTLFGGQITGRHLELAPGERIVQAWRSEGWPAHVYSIVRFELSAQGSGTKLVFDHAGFPVGQAEHLASGWKGHYWESLERYLASE